MHCSRDCTADSTTNADGRCLDLLTPSTSPDESSGNVADAELKKGLYKIIFKTKEYFESRQQSSFYPWVEVRGQFSGPLMESKSLMSTADHIRGDRRQPALPYPSPYLPVLLHNLPRQLNAHTLSFTIDEKD